MTWIRNLIHFVLYGTSAKLRPYEENCLNAWKQHLSAKAADILNRQLEKFDFIQRHSRNKLIIFYAKNLIKREWPDEDLFIMRGDRVVAQVFLKILEEGHEESARADINLHAGRLFSFEFNRSISRRACVEISRIRIIANPMAEPRLECAEMNALMGICGLDGTALRTPLAISTREEAVSLIDSALPDDYLDIVSRAEGFVVKNCRIAGLHEIRKLVRPDANFYILADIEGAGVIAVQEDRHDKELFYIDNEDEVPRPIGKSFCQGVRSKQK